MSGPTGPKECSDPGHGHVFMCPVQATMIAGMVVMAGMARRDEGIGNVWWTLGLSELRFADAEEAVRALVAGGIGDRSWITVRDVVRKARSIRAARHATAPPPDPPAGLSFRDEQKFVRWYWTAVGNGEPTGRALELAAAGIGMDRYLPPAAPDTGEPVDPAMVAESRAVIEQAKKKGGRRG